MSDTGIIADIACERRMMTPDHLALAILCTAVMAIEPPVRPVQKTQFTWNVCQARCDPSPMQRHHEEREPDDGEHRRRSS